MLSTEITFEIFEGRFIKRWYKLMSKELSKKLSPAFLWTEIQSVIKGSIEYGIYIKHLSKRQYLAAGSSLLTPKERKTIYYIYLQYEMWKVHTDSYDFLDVVNHVLHNTGYNLNPTDKFEYLIVDEVQDLQPKTIKLLMMHTGFKVIFAGDTAQTIAKGVNNRIADLSSLFSNAKFKTETIPLTINYRSQNNILQLANNVVKIIELIFPMSIDKMASEVAEQQGPKPYVIAPMGHELLKKFFFGGLKENQKAIKDLDYSILEEGTNEEVPLTTELPHFGAS